MPDKHDPPKVSGRLPGENAHSNKNTADALACLWILTLFHVLPRDPSLGGRAM